MLLIIELLFLVAGFWAIISGKLPQGLFRFLFGKGEYELSPIKARIFGIFLASPLPVSFFASFLLTAMVGAKADGYSILFELFHIIVTVAVSIIVARKARHSETETFATSQTESPSLENKTTSYSMRLLILFGITILFGIALVSALTLIMTIITSKTVGTRLTGNFWSDIFPFILIIVIFVISAFGVYKLFKILRG